jgi:hypothetical protein
MVFLDKFKRLQFVCHFKKFLAKKRLGCPIAESLYQQNNKGGSDK